MILGFRCQGFFYKIGKINMRLNELFEKYPKKSSDDFFELQDEIERIYNSEAFHAKEVQEDFYKRHRMGLEGFVPTFEKPAPDKMEDKWSTKPTKKHPPSAGFVGRENAKRQSGHENYDRSVDLRSPHDDPAIPWEHQQLIPQARKRLGLD